MGRGTADAAMNTGAQASPIPVLLYHRIPARASGRFDVAEDRFIEQLQVIAASGRTLLRITELADCLRGSRPLPRRAAAVTIDDGYADTPSAVSRLLDLGLGVTVYVTLRDLDRPDGLSAAQLRALAEWGERLELGAHSLSHSHLDALPALAIAKEVGESKHRLEALIDRPVDTFAYPHGAYDRRVRAAVIKAGFRSAAAVKNALSHPDDDPWAIARYTVTSRTSPHQLHRLLAGDGAPLAWRHQRLRTRTAGALRRGWHASTHSLGARS
jgi:peptidoglycan/xylan/chitin deacetylase (PgdA/CDA1 family)